MSRVGIPKTLTVALEAGRRFVALPEVEVVLTPPAGAAAKKKLGLSPLRVGSDPFNDLVCEDVRVSRSHCRLTLTEDGVLLEDVGSKNGLYVGTVRIRTALLQDQAPVRMGGHTLHVQLGKGELRVPFSSEPFFGRAHGVSLRMRALFEQLVHAAASDSPLLLVGESGTGKELLARGVHEQSPRSEGPFVVLDCSALPEGLVESELLGHEAGAFTGAVQARAGALERAHRGTLFLDEVGELTPGAQTKLLRSVEARRVRRVGGTDELPADVRLVAATHRDLTVKPASGGFRPDLYYRLAVLQVHVPPLRERKEDLPLLAEHLLKAQNPPRSLADLPAHALDMLYAHDWPGNVRELKNTLVRWVVLPDAIPGGSLPPSPSTASKAPFGHLGLSAAREAATSAFEQSYIRAKLEESGGNVSGAARSMGISRQFLHKLMARHDLRGHP